MADDRDAWSFGADIIGTDVDEVTLVEDVDAVAAQPRIRRAREQT
jgi:hypothetical protein